ncbi:MAG TPA: YqhR family membrane protein [Chitinophagaceae bacterium]|nr:YqhR family membrane protein [Chitinophagaceae bacterium]
MEPSKPFFVDTALKAGIIAGVLDATSASIQYYLLTEKNPALVFKFIASAVFGNQVNTSGTLFGWAAVGLVFHFIIAILFAFFFFLSYKFIKKILPNWILAGIVYGLIVWSIMNLIVVPLFFGNPFVFDFKKTAIAALILIVAIGLPVSYFANRYFKQQNATA